MILRITCNLLTIISMFLYTSQTMHAQDVNLLLGSIAPGASITIKYKVDVNITFTGTSVSNQGEVSGTNFTTLLTDDPDVGGASDPTTTPIVQPAVPVELVSFKSSVKNNNVELLWETSTEVNNFGFEVQRRLTPIPSQPVSPLASQGGREVAIDWTKIGFVPGAVNSNSPKSYSFTDKNLGNGKYSYRLKQIDSDGKFSYSYEIEVVINKIPKDYTLLQNYPNPFNPSTKIEYTLPSESHVKLTIYNILGEQVSTIVNETKTAGYYNVSWNAKDVPSGIYFYSLETSSAGGTENFKSYRKMILIK